MGIVRKWIFPIIRILLVVVIAGALVKLAFFPDGKAEADPARPTGQISEPHYTVGLGTVTNDVTLKATVSADPAVPVRATAQGTVDDIFVQQGATVDAGDAIFDIKVETPREGLADDGTPLKPLISFTRVLAPSAGILSSLTVIHGQAQSIGDTAGQVAPPSYSISGSLSPEQQYRLVNQPTDALIAITGGPAPFTCTGLSITTPLPGATGSGTESTAGTGGSGTSGGASGTTVRCAVPSGITVFPGLAAEMTIAGGKAENVVVVPTTAVRGAAQTGTVWVVAAGAAPPEERAVTLGLSDGRTVEVASGLSAGDEILQFAPGAQAPEGGSGENLKGDGGVGACDPGNCGGTFL